MYIPGPSWVRNCLGEPPSLGWTVSKAGAIENDWQNPTNEKRKIYKILKPDNTNNTNYIQLQELWIVSSIVLMLTLMGHNMVSISFRISSEIQNMLVCALLLHRSSEAKRRNKRVFNYCQTSVSFFNQRRILSVYQSLLALHLSGTPSLKTGTRPPSCQLLDNCLNMCFVWPG